MRGLNHTVLVFSHFRKRQHVKPVCLKGLLVYLLFENSNNVLNFAQFYNILIM